MRTPYFRRFFILFAIIFVFSVILTEFYITRIVRNNFLDTIRNDLAARSRLIADNIEFNTSFINTFILNDLKDKTNSRITIIAPDGTVLGDSDEDASIMDNHRNRPEIQQAGLSGTGWSIRHSRTLKSDLFYTAIAVKRMDKVRGYVRLALPLDEVNASINSLRFKIVGGVILILLAAGLLTTLQTVRVRSYVSQITELAGALARGIFTKRLHLEGAGEFSEIAEDLNTMSKDLQSLMSLKDAEADRLNVILKSIPDPLLIINKEGIIERSNNAVRELTGNSTGMGKHFYEVIRSPELFSLIDDVKERQTSGIADMKLNEPTERYITARVSPLFYRKRELAGYIAILHDTTRLKRLEEMRKDFVANVSHEIKTPITAISGFAETLIDGAIDDRDNALTFLETIRSHSQRLNRLVDDLLMISKLELGVEILNKKETDIADVIDSVINTLGKRANEKGLKLQKSIASDDTHLMADRDKLIEIFLNLTDNAIKFTDQGEITLGMDREKEKNYLFVKDKGIGVPQKYVSRLGERFFRVDTSRSRELGGTGLGLAIVKHIVLAHGWEMKLESEEGKGTTVKIFIS
jgi:two-component system phosphate regulon sensor histidine kinase PhoR